MRRLFRAASILLLALLILTIGFRTAAVWRESEGTEAAPAQGDFIKTPLGAFYTMSAGPADGQALLLAHGTAAWSGFWAPQVASLGQLGYRATAFDLPPFGFSDRAVDGDYSRHRQADRILALVDAMKTRPVMIAHSFGASAAVEAVMKEPEAFAGLVIVSGALAMSVAPDQRNMPLVLQPRLTREAALSLTATNPLATGTLLRGLLYNKEAATYDIFETLQRPQRRSGTTAAYADWLPALLAPDASARSRQAAAYNSLTLPVRIIWGDRDTVTPPDQAEALAAAIGQMPVMYLKDVGHIPHLEAPDIFMKTLKRALSEIAQAR